MDTQIFYADNSIINLKPSAPSYNWVLCILADDIIYTAYQY